MRWWPAAAQYWVVAYSQSLMRRAAACFRALIKTDGWRPCLLPPVMAKVSRVRVCDAPSLLSSSDMGCICVRGFRQHDEVFFALSWLACWCRLAPATACLLADGLTAAMLAFCSEGSLCTSWHACIPLYDSQRWRHSGMQAVQHPDYVGASGLLGFSSEAAWHLCN